MMKTVFAGIRLLFPGKPESGVDGFAGISGFFSNKAAFFKITEDVANQEFMDGNQAIWQAVSFIT